MDAIVKWISENPYLTALGLFATFGGLILAIIIPIIQRKRKQLYYTVSTTPLVTQNVSSIKDLEMLFAGKHIERLSVTNIKLWNSGNTLIVSDDFYAGHELKIINQSTRKCHILGIDIFGQSADTIQCKIDDNATLSFQAMEKKDYVSLNIYHTGNENAIFVLEGKIKEGKIVNKTKDVAKILSKIMSLSFNLTTESMAIENFISLFEIAELVNSKRKKN